MDERCANPLPKRSKSCWWYIWCVCLHYIYIDKLLKEYERRFKDSERMKFAVSFITNPFQERDVSESVKLISYVLNENVNEL
jgi:hypothetical protein